jgi:NADP-dependent aldehyde dehydrogenase
VLDEALEAGMRAFHEIRGSWEASVPKFLELFAERIEDRSDDIVTLAHLETALPVRPRLRDVELPRTTGQLRQAANAVRSGSWKIPIISTAVNISSMRVPIPGVVCVFGPNNFPLAFNGVGGGDFAAAMATGHPVLAKANPGHPGVTRMLAELAFACVQDTGLPAAFIQMIYRTTHDDGSRLVADDRVAATAYTGSRNGGLALKSAADAAGRPIYLEMSSINPVVVLPGAIREREDEVGEDLTASMLAGSGQFCTSPGLILAIDGPETERLREGLKRRLEAVPGDTLLAPSVQTGLEQVVHSWSEAGARVMAQSPLRADGCSFANTMMEVTGEEFLTHDQILQQEAFGNLSLLVVTKDSDELLEAMGRLEGNLTGSIYSASDGSDEPVYRRVERVLRDRVGRLLNDKAPTGVSVVPSMNHGGPYPSTGHPGFTAIGIPASLARFTMLQCFDGVRDHRLPLELQASNPLGMLRQVDDQWTRESADER